MVSEFKSKLENSVVLVTSSDEGNSKFGTGFVIHLGVDRAYILTCAHVVRDVGGEDKVEVERLASTVSAIDEALDLAVLEVEGLRDRSVLDLEVFDGQGRHFKTLGFRLTDKLHVSRELQGELTQGRVHRHGKEGDRIPIWNLQVNNDESNTLQRGYSGSPVVNTETGKIIGVVSHRESDGRAGIAISIAGLSRIWRVVDGTRLHGEISKLGYEDQEQLFSIFLESLEATAVGAFLVHGPSSRYGQQWLINRLAQRFIPDGYGYGKILRIDLGRLARKNTIEDVFLDVGREFGLPSPNSTIQNIVERVCSNLQRNHILIAFHTVNRLPQQNLDELIQKFWIPLVHGVQEKHFDVNKYLLMFLVDYQGRVAKHKKIFAQELSPAWHPSQPLDSSRIAKLKERELTKWIIDGLEWLPLKMARRRSEAVRNILKKHDGVPEPTLAEIYYCCGHDWKDVERCWKL